jgi:hypothetical protein
MKERFFVATQAPSGLPELQAVYWCLTKEEAIDEAQRRKRMIPSEAKDVVLAKVLNIPKDVSPIDNPNQSRKEEKP